MNTTPAPCNSTYREKPRLLESDLQAQYKYIIENKPPVVACGVPNIDLSFQLRSNCQTLPATTTPTTCGNNRNNVTFIQPFSRACEEPINVANTQTPIPQGNPQPTYSNMTLFVRQHDADVYRTFQRY
jgi:hypothetical protein